MKKKYYTYLLRQWIVIPILILFLSGVSLLVNILLLDYSPTVLSVSHGSNLNNSSKFNKLEDGKVINGSFLAVENNLGIISLEYYTPSPIRGKIIFELRDNTSNLLAHNEYDSREIYYLNKYPFGFPTIKESKGQKYFYSIKFIAASGKNEIPIRINNLNLISSYKFSHEEILATYSSIEKYLIKKLTYSYNIVDFRNYYYLHMVPLALYYLLNLLFILEVKHSIFRKNKNVSLLLATILRPFSFMIMLNIIIVFSIPIFNDALNLLAVISWIMFIKTMKCAASLSYLFAASLLAICIFPILLHVDQITERLVSLAYLYLLIAVIHSLIEFRSSNA